METYSIYWLGYSQRTDFGRSCGERTLGAVEYFDEIANDPGAISKLCYRLRRPGKRQVKEMLVTAAETRGGRAVERATTLLEGVLEDEGWLD